MVLFDRLTHILQLAYIEIVPLDLEVLHEARQFYPRTIELRLRLCRLVLGDLKPLQQILYLQFLQLRQRRRLRLGRSDDQRKEETTEPPHRSVLPARGSALRDPESPSRAAASGARSRPASTRPPRLSGG